MNLIFNSNSFHIDNYPKRNVLVNTDQGTMIINRFDCNSERVGHGQWLLDHGNCNTLEVNDIWQAIKHITEPIIFDVGANIGTIGLWLAKIFNLGKIYCFEPQRQVFYQLCGNISLNNLYNIEAFNVALSNNETYIKVKEPNYFENNDFGTFSLVQKVINTTNNDLIVPTNTIDNFVKIHQINNLNLLKIDAEGMDLLVLDGAKETIDMFAPVIYIEHYDNKVSRLEEITNFLSDFNYHFEKRNNNLLCLK